MKINPSQWQRFLLSIPEGVKIFLMHGQEMALIRQRAEQIATALQKTLTVLPAEKSSASELLEEAIARDLFVKDICLLIEQPQESTLQAVKALVPHLQNIHPIVIAAHEPPSLPGLKAFCQSQPFCASLACYRESESNILGLIRHQLQSIKVNQDAFHYLVQHACENRSTLEKDLEKILLYKTDDSKPLTLEEARGICPPDIGGERQLYDTADKLFTHIVRRSCHEPFESHFFQDADHMQGVIPMLSYHFQRLLMIRTAVHEGLSFEKAITLLKPAAHFSQLDTFRAAVKGWSIFQIRSFLGKLFAADCTVRSGQKVHVGHLIWEAYDN